MSSSHPREPPTRVYLDESSIRCLFNGANIWERALAGEYQMTTVIDRDCRYSDEPPGTRAQVRWIVNGDVLVALVHGFWRPDGTLGASGKPDPKKVVHRGVTYCLAGKGQLPAGRRRPGG